MILQQAFYRRDTVTVARDLLGHYLVHVVDGLPRVGRICETEAYIGRMDKACHAYGYKRTKRTEPLFAAPGTSYVYLIYGMYHCLNFVTEPEEEPCAVLIRGVSPRLNLPPEFWGRNRLNGPGKLCKGFSIDKSCNSLDATRPPLYVCTDLADVGAAPLPGDDAPFSVQAGPRIGIAYAEEAQEFPWRFCALDLGGTIH